MIRSLIAAAVLCILPALAPAQVLLTFTGKVKSSYLPDYAVGSTFSFYFELAPFLPPTGGASNHPDSQNYEWYEEEAVHPTLYTSVWFTGSTGTWHRPAGDNTESLAGIYHDDLNGYSAMAEAAADNDSPSLPSEMGLFAGDDAVTVVFAQGTFDFSPFTPAFSSTLPPVLDYWAQYDGYTFPQNGEWESNVTTADGQIVVVVDSFTVAVPEPSTVALLAASAIIGVILLKRHRSAA